MSKMIKQYRVKKVISFWKEKVFTLNARVKENISENELFEKINEIAHFSNELYCWGECCEKNITHIYGGIAGYTLEVYIHRDHIFQPYMSVIKLRKN